MGRSIKTTFAGDAFWRMQSTMIYDLDQVRLHKDDNNPKNDLDRLQFTFVNQLLTSLVSRPAEDQLNTQPTGKIKT